jgi:hypothetical protein
VHAVPLHERMQFTIDVSPSISSLMHFISAKRSELKLSFWGRTQGKRCVLAPAGVGVHPVTVGRSINEDEWSGLRWIT